MYDMVIIDKTVFGIVGVGVGFKAPPPPGSLTFSNTPNRNGLIVALLLLSFEVLGKWH